MSKAHPPELKKWVLFISLYHCLLVRKNVNFVKSVCFKIFGFGEFRVFEVIKLIFVFVNVYRKFLLMQIVFLFYRYMDKRMSRKFNKKHKLKVKKRYFCLSLFSKLIKIILKLKIIVFIVKLNGGRHVTGILRGFDPFMNMVIDETVEECKNGTKNNIGMVVNIQNFIDKLSTLFKNSKLSIF